MMLVHRILREPLVHFLLIGLVIFLLYAALNPETERLADGKRVELTSADAQQLVAQFRNTWGRAPSLDELDALIESKLRERILVREAYTLSMDQSDAVIERRLAQKMTFFITSAAGAVVPEEEDLKAFFEEHADRFAERPRLSFRQVYLGEVIDEAASGRLLDALNAGEDPASVGKQSLLPADIALAHEPNVDGTFGTGFFQALIDLEPGQWSGPVRSGFGYHAIFIVETSKAGPPVYEAVRDRVLAAYKEQQVEDLSDAINADIRASYDITTPDKALLTDLLQ